MNGHDLLAAPMVWEIAAQVARGDLTAISHEIGARDEETKEAVRKHVKQVADRLYIALEKIEALRPFIPAQLMELLDQFSEAVNRKQRSWEREIREVPTYREESSIDEIWTLKIAIERAMRSRIFALQGQPDF